MYDGHFGYPRKFQKKTLMSYTHKHHQKQQINKTKQNQNPKKKRKKEKHLEYTTTDLFKYRAMKARTYARALAVGRAIQ
jgi:hypothetical protein